MPRKYSLETRAEAVALAAVAGVEAAADSMGIDRRTVRTWCEQAGHAPELVAEPDAWKRLHDLAIAKVTGDLASGKMRPRDMAVVAAIAKRNLTKPAERPVAPTDVESWADQLEARLHLTYGNSRFEEIAIIALLVAWDGGDMASPSPSVQEAMAYVKGLGDLDRWLKRRDNHRREAVAVQIAANREVAAAATRAMLGAETAALLPAAEAYLGEHAE